MEVDRCLGDTLYRHPRALAGSAKLDASKREMRDTLSRDMDGCFLVVM